MTDDLVHGWDVRRSLDELNRRHGSVTEAVLAPELPIIDAHHHLWDRPPERYLLDAFLADIMTGHNIVATVFVECTAMWRSHGPEDLRPVGETEFVNGIAAMSASGAYGPSRINAGIVGWADLRLGDAVTPLLEAHIQAGGGRFKGIRNRAQHHPSIPQHTPMKPEPGLMRETQFRAGLRRLAAFGLVYDSWQYHTQIPEVTELADAIPEATIILDHCGGILGVADFAGRRHAVFNDWRRSMTELAKRPNVVVKLGGLGMPIFGSGFNLRDLPPGSDEIVPLWAPYIETCIGLFGPARCMFESNFPPDKQTSSYRTIWNTFKRITRDYSTSERSDLFSGTANRVYGLGIRAA